MRTPLIASSTCMITACMIAICVVAAAAGAEPYAASGQVGYLQEWELKASLAKTVSGGRVEYSGPVTLRHVGLCSVNGVEEKQATVQLKLASSRLEGTLAMADDDCRIVAPGASAAGLLTCRNGQDVPISCLRPNGKE